MKKPHPSHSGLARRVTVSAATIVAMASGAASAVEVTGSFTGWWGQPDQENHGVIVSVSELPNGEKTAVLYWANYDDIGNPSWLFAQGDIEGDTIQAELYRFEGVTFMQPNDPANNPGEKIGDMEVQFDSCLEGDVEFMTPDVIVGTGGFRIQRLTNQPGTICSGGIGDNRRPGEGLEEFDIDLVSTGVHAGAEGDAEFEIGPGKAEFEVEVEDLPTGEYELQVGEITRGTITVTEDDDGDTEGEIEFRSPETANTLLLDFDPRGQTIDVLDNGVIVLTSIAPENGDTPGQDDAPPFGNSEIEVAFNNDGVYPDGEAEAEFEQSSDEVEFEVEVEDIPTGSYALLVDGIERGQIQVHADDDETEGELEFRFPQEPGTMLLDFDPRGKLVEILEGSVSVFHGDFPMAGIGDDDDDDDAGDGGGNDDDDDEDAGDGGGNDDDDDEDAGDGGGNDDDDDEDAGDGGGNDDDDDDDDEEDDGEEDDDDEDDG